MNFTSLKMFNSYLFLLQYFPIQPHPEDSYASHMLFARGNRWKRLRAIVNPAFSSSKLKQVRVMQKWNKIVLFSFCDELNAV